MNRKTHAVRCGVERGRTEFLNSMRTPADIGYYIIGTAVFLAVIWLNRDSTIEGTDVSTAVMMFPGVVAMVASFGSLMGLATVVSTEREDGTLLRCKSMPHGMRGYVVGQLTRVTLETAFSLTILVIPASFMLRGLWSFTGVGGLLTMVVVLVLGLAGCVSIGLAVGSFFKNPRSVGGWGFLFMGGLVVISGIFSPISMMPGWLQAIGQIFPLYWMGLGMRSGLLPDEAVVVEIGESWRTVETFGVLGLWALLGLVLAPILLRRMARRESGSGVASRREAAMQRV